MRFDGVRFLTIHISTFWHFDTRKVSCPTMDYVANVWFWWSLVHGKLDHEPNLHNAFWFKFLSFKLPSALLGFTTTLVFDTRHFISFSITIAECHTFVFLINPLKNKRFLIRRPKGHVLYTNRISSMSLHFCGDFSTWTKPNRATFQTLYFFKKLLLQVFLATLGPPGALPNVLEEMLHETPQFRTRLWLIIIDSSIFICR